MCRRLGLKPAKNQAYLEKLVLGGKVNIEHDAYQDDKHGRILGYVFLDYTTQKYCLMEKDWLTKQWLKRVLQNQQCILKDEN